MKTTIKKPVNSRLLNCVLFAILVLISGCIFHAHHPDPLAGWNFSSLNNFRSNKAISDDCQSYIQQLSLDEQKDLGPSPIDYFEDETGRHAVRITIGLKGTVWRHVLIYDKDDKRIETIKYASGNYRS